MITSHGPRGVKDSSPANHYSLLSTIEQTFGLGCLKFTCDTKQVKPLTPLFTVTGSQAIATTPLPELNWPTPTPDDPAEPTSSTTASAPSRAPHPLTCGRSAISCPT